MATTIQTATSIKLEFPEFTNLTDAQIERSIVKADLIVGKSLFGKLYEMAIQYYIAHLTSLQVLNTSSGGTGGGFISSATVDGLTEVVDNGTTIDNGMIGNLSQTTYGRSYIELRRSVTHKFSIGIGIA